MILFAVAFPQDRIGEERKEKILEKLLGVEMSKEDYHQFIKNLKEKYSDK
ncbi:hypothetical protein NMY3_02169 [Candidatus Nitrosocosmicus oleophilus]|uniref:Uncharacterized protein n=1 Tax=Candidatus Nitrosocosmicus oleophilus TaxID=1353260 RepID=A0A654M1J8_9ARCH|nr:hypothetical protein [Candidatus Nitrosocosmicus oleophilus]ALI36369.1 hypothetical protein NMY3_02169 [Candidatus Nitrosocosmicus oleophilus]